MKINILYRRKNLLMLLHANRPPLPHPLSKYMLRPWPPLWIYIAPLMWARWLTGSFVPVLLFSYTLPYISIHIHSSIHSTHFYTFLYISIHFYTFLYISTHFYTCLHISIDFNIFLYISTHFYTFLHISIHFYTFL